MWGVTRTDKKGNSLKRAPFVMMPLLLARLFIVADVAVGGFFAFSRNSRNKIVEKSGNTQKSIVFFRPAKIAELEMPWGILSGVQPGVYLIFPVPLPSYRWHKIIVTCKPFKLTLK